MEAVCIDSRCFLLISGGFYIIRARRLAGLWQAVGLVAAFGGMLFLSTYLLITSFQVGGDVKSILLGERRAHQ